MSGVAGNVFHCHSCEQQRSDVSLTFDGDAMGKCLGAIIDVVQKRSCEAIIAARFNDLKKSSYCLDLSAKMREGKSDSIFVTQCSDIISDADTRLLHWLRDSSSV